MTTYTVFKQVSEGWLEHTAAVEATSAQAAVRKAVSEGGTYVAVPKRSWKPVTVEAVQTTVLKLS